MHVVKTKTKKENSKQFIHLNLSYKNCLSIHINGVKIPKTHNVWVTPLKNEKDVIVKAKGLFNNVIKSIPHNSNLIDITFNGNIGGYSKKENFISKVSTSKISSLTQKKLKAKTISKLKDKKLTFSTNITKTSLKSTNFNLKNKTYTIKQNNII